ncbi:MAG: 4Fe-4S dicluster domain-containing protein [Chloroflexi bacterium]|nr:4Fe-4S dicluster domain-containing protein [Chloroflexota bacterium]
MSQGKNLSRRQFLKLTAATGAAALGANVARPVSASVGVTRDNVPAMLIDLSRCVGCGNCQRSCNEANNLHPTTEQLKGLSSQTYTYVEQRDLEGDKTRWVKRQCMHCLDAACASACPVSALHKTPEGPIAYHAKRCLGCRYCMVSCPFGVPRFDWNNGLTPEIRKCMFCIERQRAGEGPACAVNCPSGALKVGTRAELLKEAHARIAANPKVYVDHVYGEQEAGGTAMLYISDVSFQMLGFRTDVTTRPLPAYTWDVMSKLPAVVGGLAVVLTGASVITRRKNGHHDDTPPWERTEEHQ